ncbi:MAG: hypothetical protein ACYCQJ_02245 [Nitrososphaerales archaeon]
MVKTWSVIYALVWATFAQIFLIVFLLSVATSGFWFTATIGLHIVVALLVIALAGFSFRLVSKSGCPNRIKRISKATMILAGVQGVLGVVLYALIRIDASIYAQDFVLLLHIVTALAIFAQASSSATAYDMWEEKEFVTMQTNPM